MRAAEYGRRKAELLPRVLESFAIVGEDADIVLVEGAGSPAEVNLRAGDIANMGFAEAADVPVVLRRRHRPRRRHRQPGRHRMPCLPPADRGADQGLHRQQVARRCRRCSPTACATIAERTGWPCLGVVPWFEDARRLPAEDVLGLVESRRAEAARMSSRCRRCRASPTSTISTRCGWSRASPWSSSSPARPIPATPTWS